MNTYGIETRHRPSANARGNVPMFLARGPTRRLHDKYLLTAAEVVKMVDAAMDVKADGGGELQNQMQQGEPRCPCI